MASLPKMAARLDWAVAQVKADLILLLLYQALAILVVILAPLLAWRGSMLASSALVADLVPALPPGSPWVGVYVPYLVGGVYLLAGLAALSLRRDERPVRLFALFAASVAIALATLYDLSIFNALGHLRLLSLALAAGTLVHLAWVFPRQSDLAERYPVICYLAYIPLGLLLPLGLAVAARLLNPAVSVGIYLLVMAGIGFGWLLLTGRAAQALARSPSLLVREQSRLILLGCTMTSMPLLMWFYLHMAQSGLADLLEDILARPFLLLPLAAFPLFLGYALLRYRIANVDDLLSRARVYGLLMLLVVGGYALLVSGLSLILQGTLFPPGEPGSNSYLAGLAVFLLALLFNPLRLRLQQGVERNFFKARVNYQEQLRRFSRELVQTGELLDILQLLRRFVEQAVRPASLHIFVLDETGKYYRAAGDGAGRRTSDIRFASDSPLAQFLARHRGAVFIDQQTDLPGEHAIERAQIAVLGAQLFLPLAGPERLAGWLALGLRRGWDAYPAEASAFLETLCDQVSLGLERALIVSALKSHLGDKEIVSRVAELSVLQRIARQLNAGLDLERVMHITLDCALEQSGAEAGLIGMLEGEQVRVKCARGYPESVAPVSDSLVALDLPVWAEILNGLESPGYAPAWASKAAGRLKAQIRAVRPGNENGQGRPGGFLTDARAVAVVPIQREERAVGVLVLESSTRSDFVENTLGFLARLSEQAAIAISNAQLYAAIQNASLAKSQFVSSAAHELKNPLTSIKGYTDLLVGGAVGPVTDGQARFLAIIRSNAERMSTLVSDLQDISRIEADQLRLQFAAVSIPEALDEVARTLRKAIDEKDHQLTIDLGADLPPVWCDSTRLVQVLTNLLSNACKYTPPGGQFTIRAELMPKGWAAGGARQVVHFAMKDNGIGISSEDQAKIFQQFFRSEDPRVREMTGTGLGLTISRNLVEMQGGKIWFESAAEQGTTFHFTIPVAEAEQLSHSS